MKFIKGHGNSNFTGPHKSQGKAQTLSHRNPSFHGTNATSRVLNHPALITSQAMRDGPCGSGSTLNSTIGAAHMH